MIKEIAWNTFKNTGSINTFLELREIENLQNNIQNNMNNQKVNIDEYCKNEGNNNCRK